MSNLNCNGRGGCITASIVASLIIGIITAFLRITAAITLTPAFLWVLLGVAVVYLAVLLLKNRYGSESCVCTALRTLLAGILGTALTAVILLGITFVATSIIGAVITGLLLAFFSLILTASACLIKCEAGCDD
ncbi:MAG: hypothetical protein IJ300_03660 [Clostridia bacterium]|nr:hypothetical protein [Clostridia bacterium]